MARVLALLALIGCVYAQGDLASTASSPYEIARWVDGHSDFDWQPLWAALGMRDVRFGKCEGRRDAMRSCSTEIITVSDPPQSVLIIEDQYWHQIYLRFAGDSEAGWRFEGHFEPSVKYFEPRHRRLTFGRKPFLTITEQGISGTGVSSEIENWFDLTAPGLTPVFSLLIRGSESSGMTDDVAREVIGTATPMRTDPTETISVSWMVRFSVPDEPGVHLPFREGQAIYTRQPGQRFDLDPQHSRTSRAEIDTLFQGIGNFDGQDFLKYELDDLKKIASGPETRERRWLKRFVMKCEDTPEKRALESLLANRAPR